MNHELHAGALRLAVRPDLGGVVAGLWHRETPILRSTEPGALVDSRKGAMYPLLPYSNRLGYLHFRWKGHDYTTRANVPDSPHSMHGIGWQRPWHVVSSNAIELVIGMGDKPVDLIQEGVDCVLRVGTLQDSSLVARRIGVFQGVTCASPAYLERHGEPQTLDDLANHTAVNYFSSRTGRVIEMDFMVNGQASEIKIPSTIAVNDAEAYLSCGVDGYGLIQPARFMALPFLRSGQLKEVLPQWKPQPMPISAVYPHNRHLSSKVRVFVEWVAEMFERCPLLQGQDESALHCLPTTAPAGSVRSKLAVPAVIDASEMVI